MESYEVNTIFEFGHYAHKDEWEQARTISYVTAQSHSTKQLSPDKIMTFPWEKNNEATIMSDEEYARLSRLAEKYCNN